ncbi:hypothetical protein D3C84_803290 [compost metagenome]
MIEICPAGPPKLMKPSFSQNQNACSRLTGAVLDSACSCGMAVSLMGAVFHCEGRQQAIDDGTGGGQGMGLPT